MDYDENVKPYKICDVTREKRIGVVATSLVDLLSKIPEKLGFPAENSPPTVVLEVDGTEVDDEDYFATLEPHTSLMVLRQIEKWHPNVPKCQISLDQTDASHEKVQIADVVGRIQHSLCHISLLGGEDLELLANMDPDNLVDIVSDKDNKIFLEQLKEASGRILLEKQQAHDAMELLKLYHQSVSNGVSANQDTCAIVADNEISCGSLSIWS
ncbi:DNA fragmentation factor subunit alpha-like isoform X2 [Arctopsyche grandis]|uniref:DNA fragmentation factor subunit alpha-like isoform X2 n=1 Tax=Arctopsyche grandis TaxID=121162 RepID=UPI00406D9F57